MGKIDLSKDLNNDQLNDILKKLYETNFFSDVSLSIDNKILKLKVVENPIIENIEITGIRNNKLLEDIYENISLQNRMSFTENLLIKDIELIKNIHKSAGYYFVDVKTSINKDEKLNSLRLKIDIIQGEKAKIKKIFFIGDK